MEYGFYHPSVGYWQTSEQPSTAVLATYPAGYVSAPVRPAGDVTFDGTAWVPAPAPTPTVADVNRERDRREFGGFTFQGNTFDSDPESLTKISGAAALAGFAIFAGAQPGDTAWHATPANPTPPPFTWITQDNQQVVMDAQTVFAFGRAAAHWVSSHVFAARAIKDIPSGIPADFADNLRWP